MQVAYATLLSICLHDIFNALLFSDSLLYLMPTNNLYEDLAKIKCELDLSNYPQHHALYDTSRRMTPGYFKDESEGIPIKQFCGLRAKCYSMILEDDKEKLASYGMIRPSKIQKLATAGVKSSVHKELFHQRFIDVLERNSTYNITQQTIRSKCHTLYTLETTRIGLSALDIKRYILNDGITTLPYGHYQIMSE
jgi:hypothetical protein